MSDPHERSMFVLLCFLIGVLVFHPLLGGQEFESRGLNLLTSAGLVLIVWTLRRERWALAIGIGLGLPCLGLNLLALWQTPGRILDLLGHALLATFYGFTAAVFLKHILFSHGLRVKRATLYESACVYLLLGLFWGTLYSFMEHLSPGSFHLDPALADRHLDWSDFLYHSFVTLTTLGYGDLVPVAPMARSLTLLEAVVGVFYVTALVARLVSIYRPEEMLKGESDGHDCH